MKNRSTIEPQRSAAENGGSPIAWQEDARYAGSALGIPVPREKLAKTTEIDTKKVDSALRSAFITRYISYIHYQDTNLSGSIAYLSLAQCQQHKGAACRRKSTPCPSSDPAPELLSAILESLQAVLRHGSLPAVFRTYSRHARVSKNAGPSLSQSHKTQLGHQEVSGTRSSYL